MNYASHCTRLLNQDFLNNSCSLSLQILVYRRMYCYQLEIIDFAKNFMKYRPSSSLICWRFYPIKWSICFATQPCLQTSQRLPTTKFYECLDKDYKHMIEFGQTCLIKLNWRFDKFIAVPYRCLMMTISSTNFNHIKPNSWEPRDTCTDVRAKK